MSNLTPRIDRMEKNYIINGDMRIAQRGTSFAAIATDTYSLDRWVYRKNGTMVHTVTQDTDVPTFAQSGYLFQNSYRANLTTPQTSIGAGNFALIRQRIEGYNWANLAQKAFSVSFWVKATLPGIYYLSCANTGGNQCIASSYTINSASTWEFKTVNVAASPSSGTWNYTNGTGLAVDFVLACGSTFFSPTPGSWTTTQSFVGSDQINGVNTGATDFRVTGVMVVEGTSTNTKFSTFARDFAGELQVCQRYYEQWKGLVIAGNTQVAYCTSGWAVPKRASPTTVTLVGTFFNITNGTNPGVTSPTYLFNANGPIFVNSSTGVLTTAQAYTINDQGSAYLAAEAEL